MSELCLKLIKFVSFVVNSGHLILKSKNLLEQNLRRRSSEAIILTAKSEIDASQFQNNKLSIKREYGVLSLHYFACFQGYNNIQNLFIIIILFLFVFCYPIPTGKLRYANNSNYKNDVMIRKEVSVTKTSFAFWQY